MLLHIHPFPHTNFFTLSMDESIWQLLVEIHKWEMHVLSYRSTPVELVHIRFAYFWSDEIFFIHFSISVIVSMQLYFHILRIKSVFNRLLDSVLTPMLGLLLTHGIKTWCKFHDMFTMKLMKNMQLNTLRSHECHGMTNIKFYARTVSIIDFNLVNLSLILMLKLV